MISFNAICPSWQGVMSRCNVNLRSSCTVIFKWYLCFIMLGSKKNQVEAIQCRCGLSFVAASVNKNTRNRHQISCQSLRNSVVYSTKRLWLLNVFSLKATGLLQNFFSLGFYEIILWKKKYLNNSLGYKVFSHVEHTLQSHSV